MHSENKPEGVCGGSNPRCVHPHDVIWTVRPSRRDGSLRKKRLQYLYAFDRKGGPRKRDEESSMNECSERLLLQEQNVLLCAPPHHCFCALCLNGFRKIDGLDCDRDMGECR